MSWFKPSSVFDKVFEGGILIKGFTGLAEFLGGLMLFFVSADQIHAFITLITQRELLEDPHDFVANTLLHSTESFSSNSETFLIVYLWLHAAIKLIAVIGIMRNQRWAYPFSLITLGVLMLYQLYSIFFIKLSLGMIALTIFDVFILWMIWLEYGRIRSNQGAAT